MGGCACVHMYTCVGGYVCVWVRVGRRGGSQCGVCIVGCGMSVNVSGDADVNMHELYVRYSTEHS